MNNFHQQHPSLAIVKGAGLVMKAIIEEADSETAAKMQELALAEVSFYGIIKFKYFIFLFSTLRQQYLYILRRCLHLLYSLYY